MKLQNRFRWWFMFLSNETNVLHTHIQFYENNDGYVRCADAIKIVFH